MSTTALKDSLTASPPPPVAGGPHKPRDDASGAPVVNGRAVFPCAATVATATAPDDDGPVPKVDAAMTAPVTRPRSPP